MNRFVEQMGDGEEIALTLDLPHIGRTRAQEKFFHGPILKGFMQAMDYAKQEAKDYLALLFIPVDLRLPDGTYVRVPGHTSALSKEDYSGFIEACIRHAAEHDIYIEDASEWLRKNGRAA